MNLFVEPKMKILEDGSVKINVQAITTKYIDNHIKILESIGNLNIDEVFKVIRNSNCSNEARKNLISQFNITTDVADFILEMELQQIDNYLNDEKFRNTEIAKWKALSEIIG